jgi:hypothetical protein
MVENNNRGVRHETSDASVRGILAFGGGMILLAIVINLIIWWIFSAMTAPEKQAKQPMAPWASSRSERFPREPHLEGLEALRAQEQPAPEDLLQSYGWVDRQAGIVRIPIGEAMKLLAGRLPSQAESEPESSSDHPPSRSNSGRGTRREQP